MRARLLWKELQSSYWFRPSLWVVGLGLLGYLLARVDQRLFLLDFSLLPSGIIGGASGAQTMLNAIATAILTVAALAYSVIMLAVVQTANAYSPRLLDEYLSDTANQHVLGILIGTFLYTLLVLREVRSTESLDYVPAITVAVGLFLATACVGAFVFFLNHVAHSIEVSSIVWRIKAQTSRVIEMSELAVGNPWNEAQPPSLPEGPGMMVRAGGDGYVGTIDMQSLLAAACASDLVIRVEIELGQYVIKGSPLAAIWPPEKVDEGLAATLRNTITLGRERTIVQDLLYGLQQLTDVAARALSTAINDPTTAINCVDVLTSLLAEIARRPIASPYRCDDDGAVRLIVQQPGFSDALDISFNLTRYYARRDSMVLLRLLDACRHISHVAEESAHREALWRHVARTAYVANEHVTTPWERAAINQHLQLAATVMGRDATQFLLSIGPALTPVS